MKYRRMAIFYLVVILLASAILIYASAGYPALSPRMAFRRFEAAKLLGPSEILETLHLGKNSSERITLGKSDYGYTTFLWKSNGDLDKSNLFYFPKEGNTTLIAPLIQLGAMDIYDLQIPLFVFTEYTNANKAVLRMELSDGQESVTLDWEASEHGNGYFLFMFSRNELSTKQFHVLLLSLLDLSTPNSAIVNVTLYDYLDNTIDTVTRDLTVYPQR